MNHPDILIIGGGIIGLAAAYQVTKLHPQKTVILLEKEPELAGHQSGRNSGVLHAGIYYKPGSLKAINCRKGKAAMEEFCVQEGINYKTCGKVIVAVDAGQMPALQSIYERGQANRVKCELIGPARLRELEPHAAGIKAIHVPETGIVDFTRVCARLADLVRARGHRILTGVKVTGLMEKAGEATVETTGGEFRPRYIINCAGLHSDRVASMSAGSVPARIIPFRGEYYKLTLEAEKFCNALIYPVPDPRFPFLGVHFTRKISGEVKCGPNAVLACAREGYLKSEINLQDLLESLTYPGFAKIAGQYWRTGLGEIWRSLSKNAFVKALQRLVPEVTAEHLLPYPAGVRAQAVTRDGRILDDFAFLESPRMVHVINAPSPGATASLSIGRAVVERLARRFH
ncbi:MAG: L-2-hydroxyglutarate oxidase [Deltaproteobacteria bacterium]|nr:MAG: L-2-hydroxyglutarate oxidase [Deltaproteobacteria bacterium]